MGSGQHVVTHTFHDVDGAARVSFLDDGRMFVELGRVHTVDNLQDLGHVQVLHEVVVQDRILDQLFRSTSRRNVWNEIKF